MPTRLADPDATDDEPDGGWPAESGQAFVKFFGEGSNRVAWSFPVLEEVARSGCHWACTYPTTKRPRQVEDGDTLFIGRLVEDPNDTLIFGRVIGREHVPGRDEASAAEIEARPWKRRWGIYICMHHAEFIAGELRNGVSLTELMDVWGSERLSDELCVGRSGLLLLVSFSGRVWAVGVSWGSGRQSGSSAWRGARSRCGCAATCRRPR